MENEQKGLTIICKSENLVPARMTELVNERNITTALQSVEASDLPTIRKIVKELGPKEAAAMILMQLTKLEMMLNVSKPMAPEALAETSKEVVDMCLNCGVGINIADIEIIFKRARRGDYGKFYGGIGCADVMGWFQSYFAEKCDACVEYNVAKSQQYKFNGERSSEYAKERERNAHREARIRYIREGG